MQWDDEGMARQPVLDLFDAFGSTEKTLHANLGGHTVYPVVRGGRRGPGFFAPAPPPTMEWPRFR